jgi:hypothetical protein
VTVAAAGLTCDAQLVGRYPGRRTLSGSPSLDLRPGAFRRDVSGSRDTAAMIAMLAAALGLSDEAVDDLVRQAATIAG